MSDRDVLRAVRPRPCASCGAEYHWNSRFNVWEQWHRHDCQKHSKQRSNGGKL